MCQRCENQFAVAVQDFDKFMADMRQDHDDGNLRDTPAKRVRDVAMVLQEASSTSLGRLRVTWLLAVATERLLALECAGQLT